MSKACSGCRDGQDFETPFSMAFQPIVQLSSGAVFAHEALARGAEGQGGIGPALEKVNEWTLAQFTTVLREGKTPERELGAVMPRFTDAQLTDSDVANVYAFIKTLY